jgi:ABC-2 type transport system permease protein
MFKQFIKLTAVEFKIFLREPMAVFFNLFFPLMFLFLTMHVFLPKEAVAAGAINDYIPAFIIIITTGVSFFNIPIYIVKYRNSKFLKRLRVAPLNPITILLSLGTANLLMLVFGLVLLVAIGLIFYGAEFQGNVFLFGLGVLLCFSSLGSLGLMIASFSRGLRTANVIGQLVYYPMLFLSGAIPLKLPGFLEVIAKILPITYAVELTKQLWNRPFFEQVEHYQWQMPNPWHNVLILSAYLAVGLFISLKTFKWE